MKIVKLIGLAVVILGAVLLVTFMVYLKSNEQYFVETSEMGTAETGRSVLIATQGSEFKNSVVADISASLVKEGNFIKIIDVSELNNEALRDWDAYLIIASYEKYMIHPEVETFFSQADNFNNIIFLQTSGSGEQIAEGYEEQIDTITSASHTDTLSAVTMNIMGRLDLILNAE